jgi:FtsP/CotA-like multicopper oxidase with cupredoxin domain
VTVAPDGVSRPAIAINGTIPGPIIFADWGDTVVVHVTNGCTTSTNGTSFHFHGIRQNFTNQMDGVAAITECPTAPGESITYTWRATQYGSTWYHSHFALQAWEGVFGGIVINGPASSNYDEDLGLLFLSDWDHSTVDELYTQAQTRGPPTLDNALLNGTNVYGEDGSDDQTGSRLEIGVASGTSYRLRIVNTAIDTMFKFMIDNHTMTVISNDLVPIEPYTTDVLSVGIAQRYDVIVTADQGSVASDFWLRAIPQVACSDVEQADNIRAIVHYDGSTGTPSTSAYEYTDSCEDEDLSNLVPVVQKTVGASDDSTTQTVTIGQVSNLFKWFLNGTTFLADWDTPTLLNVANNATSFATSEAVIRLPDAGEWMYVVIQTALPIPHPIHLHGFDFFVLAQGSGTFSDDTALNLANPPRRDVAMLPASGFLVLAFETDNPGAWLMHCHIGWHASEGFALQFLVRESEIPALLDETALRDTCSAWTAYAEEAGAEQEDSGI